MTPGYSPGITFITWGKPHAKPRLFTTPIFAWALLLLERKKGIETVFRVLENIMTSQFSLAGIFAATSLLFVSPAEAGEDDFGPGPLIPEYGNITEVQFDMPIPEGTEFRVAMDSTAQADVGELNRHLTSAARFLNMHVAAGVPAEDIHLAVVFHSRGLQDVTNDAHYSALMGAENANAALVEALLEQGVEIYVCGQSAVYQDVGNEDLLPGVTMALSAMTAHALLQQDGYTINPF